MNPTSHTAREKGKTLAQTGERQRHACHVILSYRGIGGVKRHRHTYIAMRLLPSFSMLLGWLHKDHSKGHEKGLETPPRPPIQPPAMS